MEDNLTEWQAIWQTKKSKPMNLTELISRLNSIEQKAKHQRRTLLLLFGIMTLASIIQLSEILAEKFYLISYILTLLAIGVKLIPSLKGKYHFISNEADFNNQNFIQKLQEKMTFNTKHVLLFLLLAVLGLNFALLGLYQKGTIFNFEFNAGNRVFIHLSTLLILFFGYIVNIKRLKQNQAELSKVIHQLENMNS